MPGTDILELPGSDFLTTLEKLNNHKIFNCPGGIAPLTIETEKAEAMKERGERELENFKRNQERGIKT